MRKNAVFLSFFLVCLTLYAKDTFNDNKGGAGHADDISKLLTGKYYYSNSGNHKLFPVLTGLTHIMYLTVDSTMGQQSGRPADNVNQAMKYLEEHKNELHLKNIPNINSFLTPGGNTHGWYTHLGWDHIYDEDTTNRWLIRKEILRYALDKQFNFSLLDKIGISRSNKRDSFAALLYYVHILGDHEDNAITTAHTRLPIQSIDEQNINYHTIEERWVSDYEDENAKTQWRKEWIAQTTIIAELNKHLPIIFSKQKNDVHYIIMIQGINGYLPEGQKEKAKWLLDILRDNVPYLFKE